MPPAAAVRPPDVAADALRYQGQPYTYGGRADVPGDWDCSSFVSYVLGHDLGLALPGGGKYGDPGYPPNAHGPVVVGYARWKGAVTLPPGTPPSSGDLCVWAGLGPLGHIGIAVDGSHMISALNHVDGVVRTPISGYGPAGAPLLYRRLTGLKGAVPVPPGTPADSGAGGTALLALSVLAIPALAGVAVAVALAVIGVTIPVAAALGAAAVRRGSNGG